MTVHILCLQKIGWIPSNVFSDIRCATWVTGATERKCSKRPLSPSAMGRSAQNIQRMRVSGSSVCVCRER